MTTQVATRWVPTAAQKESQLSAGRHPWGVVHVRRPGDGFTACGEPAAHWYLFWDYRITPETPKVCAACGHALAGVG